MTGRPVRKSDLLAGLARGLDPEAVLAAHPGLTLETLAEVVGQAAARFGPDETVALAVHTKRKAHAPGRVVMHTDGASRGNPGEAGLGVLIEDGDGQVLGMLSRYLGQTTNNQAEYAAVIDGLKAALEMGATDIELRADSELVVKQINGQYRVKNEELKPRHAEAVALLRRFTKHVVKYIPREQNKEADRLANEAIDKKSR